MCDFNDRCLHSSTLFPIIECYSVLCHHCLIKTRSVSNHAFNPKRLSLFRRLRTIISTVLESKGRLRLLIMTKTMPALWSELEGVKYLEAHPTVAQFFKQTGVFSYCEKLDAFHQQIAEAFVVSFDGRIAKIGREEFIIDEAAIHECTGLPRTRECWFKTTTPSNIEFRSYLLPIHRDIIWNKNVAMTSLEPEW